MGILERRWRLICETIENMLAPNKPVVREGPPIDINLLGYDLDGMQELLRLVNERRSDDGMSELCLEKRLCMTAQRHAVWMAQNRQSHHEWDVKPIDRFDRVGYFFDLAAENIGMTMSMDVQSILSVWMGSTPHKVNLCGPYLDVGFGRAMSAGQWFWVANLGTPATGPSFRNTCVQISGVTP